MNKILASQYPEGLDGLAAPLPEELKNVIAAGLVEIDGCVLLKAMERDGFTGFAGLTDFVRKTLQDRTGVECSYNHLHMEDYVDKDTVATGVPFLREVFGLLKKGFPGRPFRGMIDVSELDEDVILDCGLEPRNEPLCVVRFHTLRDGESWSLDDVDVYELEGVGQWDL